VTRVVVLLGPPGSGKTAIGEALSRGGLRWRNWELEILERWGTRDEFVRNKATALPALHDEIRSWIAAADVPAVFETTGLSDAALLDELDAAGDALIVRLDVPEEVAVTRVMQREPGRHLTDDPDRNRSTWQAFHTGAAADRRCDLAIDTTTLSPASAAARIEAALPS
jgi:chloramphenicol 3-O-phosphotransferase